MTTETVKKYAQIAIVAIGLASWLALMVVVLWGF